VGERRNPDGEPSDALGEEEYIGRKRVKMRSQVGDQYRVESPFEKSVEPRCLSVYRWPAGERRVSVYTPHPRSHCGWGGRRCGGRHFHKGIDDLKKEGERKKDGGKDGRTV